ncbi:MAG TPA: DUF308 domain-containing protein [Microbacteriaceae bacterium]|nr:DUF308 domain-containing protein [Microbacteriaceae bacterium]
MQNQVHVKQHLDLTRTFLGISGLMALVVGVLILIFPGQSGLAVMQVTAVIMAAWMLISGVVYLGLGVFSGSLSGKNRFWNAFLGLLFGFGGFIILFNVKETAAVLALALSVTIGVVWIFEGVFTFATLLSVTHKVWGIIYAVVSIVAGIILIVTPFIGVIALWWMIGISLVALGIVQLIRAFATKT